MDSRIAQGQTRSSERENAQLGARRIQIARDGRRGWAWRNQTSQKIAIKEAVEAFLEDGELLLGGTHHAAHSQPRSAGHEDVLVPGRRDSTNETAARRHSRS